MLQQQHFNNKKRWQFMQRLIHNYKYKFKKFQIKNFNINVLVG